MREKLKNNKKKKLKIKLRGKSKNGMRNTIEEEKNEKMIDKNSILRRTKRNILKNEKQEI